MRWKVDRVGPLAERRPVGFSPPVGSSGSLDSLRALEEALLAFAGCVVVISHDRWVLDRIATHTLTFEPWRCRQVGPD